MAVFEVFKIKSNETFAKCSDLFNAFGRIAVQLESGRGDVADGADDCTEWPVLRYRRRIARFRRTEGTKRSMNAERNCRPNV